MPSNFPFNTTSYYLKLPKITFSNSLIPATRIPASHFPPHPTPKNVPFPSHPSCSRRFYFCSFFLPNAPTFPPISRFRNPLSEKKRGWENTFLWPLNPGRKRRCFLLEGAAKGAQRIWHILGGRKKGHPDLKTFSSSFDYYFF